MRFHLQNIEGGIQRMPVTISEEARNQRAQWPFVKIPAFEVMGASVREQTGFEVISFLPFVARRDVDAWQEFSLQNAAEWLEESFGVIQSAAMNANASGEYSSFVAADYLDLGPSPILVDLPDALVKAATGENYTYTASVVSNPNGPYLPFWITTPPPFNPAIININFLSTHSTFPQSVSAVLRARRPLLGQSMDMTGLAQGSLNFEDHEQHHASLVNYKSPVTNSTLQHPCCAYLCPVFESSRNRTSTVVAILSALLPFDRYLLNLLPPGVHGIDAVLRTHPSKQAFTYRLDGNSVSTQKSPEPRI
jgi:hypothetical protein